MVLFDVFQCLIWDGLNMSEFYLWFCFFSFVVFSWFLASTFHFLK